MKHKHEKVDPDPTDDRCDDITQLLIQRGTGSHFLVARHRGPCRQSLGHRCSFLPRRPTASCPSGTSNPLAGICRNRSIETSLETVSTFRPDGRGWLFWLRIAKTWLLLAASNELGHPSQLAEQAPLPFRALWPWFRVADLRAARSLGPWPCLSGILAPALGWGEFPACSEAALPSERPGCLACSLSAWVFHGRETCQVLDACGGRCVGCPAMLYRCSRR